MTSAIFCRTARNQSVLRLQFLNNVLKRTMSEIVSGKKEVNGVNLYYEQVGRGSHPLILIPGALGSIKTDFQPQMEKLNREKFTIVGFDPRGYGKSQPPLREFPLDFYHQDAKDAKELMLALGHKKFSVLGWSDGAIVGIILAAHFPDVMRKLVVWGGNSYGTDKDLELFEATRDIQRWSKRMRDPMVEIYGDNFQKLWSGWIDGVAHLFKVNDTDVCMKELNQVTAPTFILHGDKDPMVPDEHPVFIENHIKGSKLHRFPDGKHNIHLRYAEEFNKLVEDFLE